jgi:hypothetical protein
MAGKTEWYLFVLAAMLIGVVYYAGVKTDAAAFSSLFDNGFNVITGRTTAGVFQNTGQ